MTQDEIEGLRAKVQCSHLLEHLGWSRDSAQSTSRAVKYRRGPGEIIIVIHDGRGWFDPLSEAKGDVFSLAQHLLHFSFAHAAAALADLVGFISDAQPVAVLEPRQTKLAIGVRWRRRGPPAPNSAGWHYLSMTRGIPDSVLRAAIDADILREGPSGSIWAAHCNELGQILGWEERGPAWRGFSTGGTKSIFRLGSQGSGRICLTEAAIDAMSLAALEDMPDGVLYLSTGGGWSPRATAALADLLAPDVTLVAATDNDRQGEIYAERLRQVAEGAFCRFERLRPLHSDWNQDLRALTDKGLVATTPRSLV
jgi:hypothetical protein